MQRISNRHCQYCNVWQELNKGHGTSDESKSAYKAIAGVSHRAKPISFSKFRLDVLELLPMERK